MDSCSVQQDDTLLQVLVDRCEMKVILNIFLFANKQCNAKDRLGYSFDILMSITVFSLL